MAWHDLYAMFVTWSLMTTVVTVTENDADQEDQGFTKVYKETKYVYEPEAMPWEYAQSNCTLEYTGLATPTNMTFHHVISGALLLYAKNAGKVWIGGRANTDAKYSWSNGQDFGGDTTTFPDVLGRSMCGYVRAQQGFSRMTYSSDVCDRTHSAICEHPGATCVADSPTALQLTGRCLTFHAERLTWYGARAFCALEPGSRLWVTASGTPKGVLGFLAQKPQLRTRSFWIGLAKMKWIWDDGSPLHDYAQLWSEQDRNGASGCVAMEMHTGGVYLWTRELCSTHLPYLCQTNVTMETRDDMDMGRPEPEPEPSPEPEPKRDGDSPTFSLGVLLHLTSDVMTIKGPYILLGAAIGVAVMLIPLGVTCCVCYRYRPGSSGDGSRWSFRTKPDPYAAVWATPGCQSISEAAPPRYPGPEAPTAPPPGDYSTNDDHLYEAPPDVAHGAPREDPGTWPKSQGRVI